MSVIRNLTIFKNRKSISKYCLNNGYFLNKLLLTTGKTLLFKYFENIPSKKNS